MKSTIKSLLLAVCFSASLGTATAGTLEFLGWKAGPRTVNISTPVSQSVHAGEFSVRWDSVAMYAFCIEVTQNITNPGGPYTDYSKMDMAGPLDALSRLYEAHYDSIGNDADKGAAFQVAVWDLVYGDNGFQATGSVVALGEQWADDARAGNTPAGNWTFHALRSPTRQDQLVAARTAVPVPATAVLLGCGMLAIGVVRRRR